MTVTIAVGLEATIDVWVTFPSLDDLGRFARRYGGRLAEHVRRGYEAIAAGRGDEVSIDGRARDARTLVRQAREFGADIRRSLGGNGAQEAATLEAIGANAVFLGAVPSSLIAGLPPESREHFERADLSFAYVTEHRPASYILQAPMTNRFILCEGTGRRIEQLRPYLQGLPAVLERVADRYGRLDMVNLVGWHVLFANGIDDRDLRMIRNMIEDIRNAIGSPIFTDAGGLAAFDQRERRLLCKIYSLCDVLSVNEDEVLQVSRAMGASAEDEFRAMHDILTSLERVSTVWLHALEYQASLSTAYERHALEGAQVAAASA
ncbi:TPA: hypothetical protein EYP44_04865, partial [Candidatus Bathyarchaeota archaeon]|nr:hypothetical protein [Candidatus Bathyarchaeota archaeon]